MFIQVYNQKLNEVSFNSSCIEYNMKNIINPIINNIHINVIHKLIIQS